MLTSKIIQNKIYFYSGTLHKVKKVLKVRNRILLIDLISGEEKTVPYEGAEILLSRVWTIGEVSKIVERRPDTLRKYEKKGLIPTPQKLDEQYGSYKNWRIYPEKEVYEIVEFFSSRNPGRPAKKTKSKINSSIVSLNEKVKLKNRSF